MIYMWFRKDLRIEDNKALYMAKKTGEELKYIYIMDKNVLFDENPRRKKFILDRVRELDDKLGGNLIIEEGNPIEVFRKLRKKEEFEIYFNRNYEPYEIERDKIVAAEFETHSFKDFVLHERDEILKGDGSPYKVFTAYYNKWKEKDKDIEYGVSKNNLLDAFIENRVIKYETTRDYPGLDSTSKLSAYINCGAVSIRTIYYRAYEKYLDTKNEEILTFIKQLAWRDFFIQIMYHYPRAEKEAFIMKYKNIKWENDMSKIEAWEKGETGFEFIDAGMRELNETGYMHNRLRMLVASFLVKNLNVDWKIGEAYFREKLIDYDLALNNGGWQWAASTGVDSVPYFRIFNPYRQQERFDKDKEYISKYLKNNFTNGEIVDYNETRDDYKNKIKSMGEEK